MILYFWKMNSLIFLFGFAFIILLTGCSQGDDYIIELDEIRSVKKSSIILYKGEEVGKVEEINEQQGQIFIKVRLTRDKVLMKGSKFKIEEDGSISIVHPLEEDVFLSPNDTLFYEPVMIPIYNSYDTYIQTVKPIETPKKPVKVIIKDVHPIDETKLKDHD